MLKLFDRCNGHLFHDWEIVECKNACEIETDVQRSLNMISSGIRFTDHHGDGFRYVKKVCMRCKRTIDEITPKIEKRKREIIAEKSRRGRAQELYTE